MLLSILFSNPAFFIVLALGTALAISIHEAAHAFVAQKRGDPTAAMLGRTSINPLVHLDPIGSIMILFAGFGWGKPVPVNDSRLKHKYDIILVALAGPVSNFLLAALFSLVVRFSTTTSITDVLSLFIFINLSLMLFNLIPIPPLDGSKILRLFLPNSAYQQLEQYGFLLIIVLFMVVRFGSFGLSDGLFSAVTRMFQWLTGASISFL